MSSPFSSVPSPEHDLCKKCGFCQWSPARFSSGVYYDPVVKELVEGIPPKGMTPEGGWIVYIGEPMDRTSEEIDAETGKCGVFSDHNALRVFNSLAEIGQLHRVWYHPAVKCRPLVKGKMPDPENPQKRVDTIKEPTNFNSTLFRRCWHFIWPEIYEVNPTAFILGGYEGVKMVLNDGRLTSMVDKRYSVEITFPDATRRLDAYPVINTNHVWQDKDTRYPPFLHDLKKIFHRIDNPLTYGFVDVDGWMDFAYGFTAEEIEEWFEPVYRNLDKPLSWDIESTSVDTMWTKEFRLGIFSFHHPSQEKPLIVLTKDYLYVEREFQRTRSEETRGLDELLPQCLAAVRKVLEDPRVKKLGHNTLYDETAVSCAYGWQVEGFYADTLILAYLLDASAQGGRRLNDLIRGRLPGVPEYWLHMEKHMEANPQLGYNYCLYPPDLVVPYAAYDTKTVTHVFDSLVNSLAEKRKAGFGGKFVVSKGGGSSETSEVETYDLFSYAFRARRIHYMMCSYMERTGVHVDKSVLGKVALVYEQAKEKSEGELRDLPEIREFEWTQLAGCFKEKSAKRRKIEQTVLSVRKMIAAERGIEGDVPTEIDWEQDQEILLQYDDYRPRMSWASPTQAAAFFFKFLKYDPVRYTDTDNPSTGEAVLRELAARQDSEVAKKLIDFREVQKFLSSFIHPMQDTENSIIRYDGLVHAQFQPSGIKTGRLSAKKPNLQQLPRDGEVKKLYDSRFENGWLLQRDYSGLEVRVLACLSRDERLVDDFRNGRDPHLRTQVYFFKDLADKHNKSQRSICKQVLFGRIYGQTDWGLFELLRGNGVLSPFTGEAITLEECTELNNMIDALYPGVAEWVKGAHMQAIQRHFVCSPFGFVRPFHVMASWDAYINGMRQGDKSKAFGYLKSDVKKALRQSQNTPIQSSASDITVYSAWEAKRRMAKEGLRALVCCLVHDSIWVDVPDDSELPVATQILRDVMDHTEEWLPSLLKGYDPDWIIVPIIGESEVGLNAKDTYVISQEPSVKAPQDRLVFSVNADSLSPRDKDKLVDTDCAGDKWAVPFLGNQAVLKNALKAKRNAF